MTYTSLHKGWMFSAGKGLTGNDAYDVSTARDFLANNTAHMADQIGQVRVNAMCDSSADMDITNVSSVGLSPWGRAAAFGPFPLSIREDGESYRLRVRVRGYTVGGAGTAYFRLVVDTWSNSLSMANLPDITGYHNVKDLSTTSGTDSWLTDADPIMWLNTKQVRSATQSIAVSGSGSASGIFSTDVCLVYLHVFAQASNNWRMSAVYAAELRGEDT